MQLIFYYIQKCYISRQNVRFVYNLLCVYMILWCTHFISENKFCNILIEEK